MQKPHDSSAPPIVQQRIIWFSFLNALVAYGIVANVMGLDANADPEASMTMWWAVAAALAVGAILVPRLLGGSAAPYTSRFVGWALAEAIGVIGFVALFVASAPVKNLYPFLGVAFVLILLQFPRD